MKLALEASDIEPAKMAAELGVTTQTVHNYLRGDRTPIRAVVKEWARVCRVPWEWIATGQLPKDETPDNVGISRWICPEIVAA